MTANEWKYRFNILYNKITKFDAPGYKDRELSELFTLAQLEVVKSYYTPQGNKYGKGVENTEKRRKDLANLVKNAYLYDFNLSSDQSLAHRKGKVFELPTDFWLALQEECDMGVYEDDCTVPVIPLSTKPPYLMDLSGIDFTRTVEYWIRPITHDEYNLNKENPFKRPYEEMMWRLDIENSPVSPYRKRHELINFSSYQILRYRLRYVKEPVGIVVDTTTPANQVSCELIETIHDEIIIKAVMIATGITNPQEYQIKVAEAMKSE
jgi:plasmid maintenance system antidote protein VapI